MPQGSFKRGPRRRPARPPARSSTRPAPTRISSSLPAAISRREPLSPTSTPSSAPSPNSTPQSLLSFEEGPGLGLEITKIRLLPLELRVLGQEVRRHEIPSTEVAHVGPHLHLLDQRRRRHFPLD